MKKLLIAVALIAFATPALAQDALKVDSMQVIKPDELAWRDCPNLPKGAQCFRVLGDGTKAGVFITRTKFPPHFKVPPHTHPFSEVVTVISGSVWHGMGEKFDVQKGEVLRAGSIFLLPAKHAHYVWTTDEGAIVQVQATGPWGFDYIDPADDPRKKTE
jgi:quercetin dioxygenase-like cupin family protein